MMDKRQSYSSASVLPVKLLKRKELCFNEQGIIPVHAQICPTNACNLNCPFCSCAKREKSQKLSLDQMTEAVLFFSKLGTKAVTITGGGEPCCHPELTHLLQILSLKKIKSGMVTNGLLLEAVSPSLHLLTWCRVSASDYRNINELLLILESLVPYIKIDWAISYVVTATPHIGKIKSVIEFANRHNLTHVRLVSDLMNLDHIIPMQVLKNILREEGVDDSLVIYQDRQNFTPGRSDCRISLLKPVLAPDGYLYPCCGVQYALPKSSGLFPEEMRMAHFTDMEQLYRAQTIFDGSICFKCYYHDYNACMGILSADYDHEEFV
jgi:MoaA/NifB/PqqE/SkfB family radical SAM enzyme